MKHHDLKYNFTAREMISYYDLAFQTTIMFIDQLLPILVILMNIRTINFQVYITNLMKGMGLTRYIHM